MSATAAPEADPRAAFRRVFPGVVVAMFLAAVDQTILASALPAIVASLGGFADLSWVVVAYLLAATVAAPIYGHFGDRYGRRRMLLVALGVFTAASLACAAAPTLWALIASRAVQGLGGGGLMTLSQALIGENVSPRQRARFQGYFAALFGTSSTLGPVLGALLAQQFGWRAIFLVNLPLGAIAAALALRVPRVAAPPREGSRLDTAGVALLALGTASLFFALTSAGHRLPWTDLRLYGLLAFAAACLGALVGWERRAAHPVLPVQLLASPIVWRSNATVMCFAAALFASVLYLPLYLQLGRGIGIGASGLLLLPLTLSIAAASGLTGRAISRTGRLNAYAKIGLAISTVALLALAGTLSVAPTAAVLALTLIAGAGLGTVMAPTQIIVQSASGTTRLGAAVASISVSRSLGGSLGVAIVGAVLFVLVGGRSELLATVLPQLAESGGAALAILSEAQRSEIAANLDGAFRVVFLVIAAFTGAGAAIAATVPAQRL